MFEKPLSPTTQAVSNAANEACWGWGDMRPSSNNIAAAALRAAAERGILSAEHIQGTTPDDWENGWNAAMQYIKTVAKELEEI
jgi:hypothetical protein